MGEKTGPVTGAPPPLADDTKAAIVGGEKSDPMGQHEGGKDGGDKDEGKKVKSEKEREDSLDTS